MSASTQRVISCSGNFDAFSMPTSSSRPRFGSAPAAANFNSLPSQQSRRPSCSAEHQPERSLWSEITENGKLMHQKSRSFIQTYAPAQWQTSMMNGIDTIYGFVESKIRQQPPPDFQLSQENYLRRIQEWTIWLLIASVVISAVILSCSLIAAVTSKLILPFYAIFGAVYWLLEWRKRSDANSEDGGSGANLPKLLNCWWFAATITDLVALVIRHMIIGERMESCDNWFDRLAHCGVPLAVFGGAKLYLDYSARTLSSSLQRSSYVQQETSCDRTLQLGLCFFVTYAVRYFSVRGFTLLPELPRPFLGYVAGFSAVLAFQKKLSLPGLWIRSSTRLCDHCRTHEGSNRSSTSQPAFGTMSSFYAKMGNSNRFHVIPDGDLLRFSSGSARNSRRVSLPAGPLAPAGVQSTISEARGLIADMLAQKDLPPYLVSGLKAVSSLLLPANQVNNFFFSSSQFDFLGSLPRVLETPYIGADANLVRVESVGQRRQSPIVVTWSTTTSATGLPTVEPEPSRARSSSYWKHRHAADEDESKAKQAVSPRPSAELDSNQIQLSDGTLYNLTELEKDPKLAQIEEWSLPIFELHNDFSDTVLTRVAYTIFQRSDLFRIFKISKRKFFSFFHTLEKGYWNIAYHNRIHAADVLHATYYFATNKLPAITAEEALRVSEPRPRGNSQCVDDDAEEDRKAADDNANELARALLNGLEEAEALDQKNAGSLASVLSSLEMMALFTAAAMHDYDHPGRTNAFLVAIEDEKAILYNDRSVLENHHAAASWQLLNRPENNFVEHLDTAEFKRFRYMIIEAILATDLKRHFEILMDFNGKVGSHGLDWDNESDKLLTCQICIKMADINSPTKPYPLHREWTNRIVEEFYAQGDEEQQRGLPVSPYMDRRDPQLAKLQDSFITHLVAPLVQAMSDAGLLTLPVVTIDPADPNALPKSELLTNLECNQKYWKALLDEAKDDLDDASAPTLADNGAGSEMETIQEQDDENGSSSPAEVSP